MTNLFLLARLLSRRSGSSWSRKNTITPPGGGDVFFGLAVSLGANGVLAVGAPKYSVGSDKGAVYIYQQSVLDSFQFDYVTILYDDNDDDGFFGSALEVSGTMLLVGAPIYKHSSGDSTGAVFHFKYSGTDWEQIGKLFAPGVIFSCLSPPIIADPLICTGPVSMLLESLLDPGPEPMTGTSLPFPGRPL